MKSRNLEETQGVAKEWLEAATTAAKNHGAQVLTGDGDDHVPLKLPSATVLGLCGDLGAGKTAFTKCLASLLGVTETVTSPTFVIQKNYSTTHPFFKKFIHIDAYRLEHPEELSNLGFENLLKDPHSLIVIEWPQKVASILPATMHKICFAFVDESTRDIVVDPL